MTNNQKIPLYLITVFLILIFSSIVYAQTGIPLASPQFYGEAMVNGRDVPIVIDPRFGAGRPIIEGRNLRTDIVVGRFKNGQPVESIADDFDLHDDDVKEVLKYAA